MVFQFGGCDPIIRETFLDAFETAAVAIITGLIQALFQIVQDLPQDGASGQAASVVFVAPSFFVQTS
jgi:hypothetical protein